MNNQVALITGSSGGIGAAVAVRLARDFSHIALTGRNLKELGPVAQSITAAGAEVFLIEADLRLVPAAEEVIQKTLAQFGKLNALVNIAGAVPQEHLFAMTEEQWNDGEQMKLHGARRLTIMAWEALSASQGSVIFTSGNTAVTPKPGFAAVGVINAAIAALSKTFAEQGISDGVQVNCVMPGAVMTKRRQQHLAKWSEEKSMTMTEAEGSFLKEIKIKRYGQPEEIAELMAFLLSPLSRWITGTVQRIDGGEIKAV
jgi:3-oxoacyl-[acyl-carrier protein] reductase